MIHEDGWDNALFNLLFQAEIFILYNWLCNNKEVNSDNKYNFVYNTEKDNNMN